MKFIPLAIACAAIEPHVHLGFSNRDLAEENDPQDLNGALFSTNHVDVVKNTEVIPVSIKHVEQLQRMELLSPM